MALFECIKVTVFENIHLKDPLKYPLYKGSEVLIWQEIFSPLQCKKIRIGAIEIWVLKNFWPFIDLKKINDGTQIWTFIIGLSYLYLGTFLVLVYQGLNEMKPIRKAIKDSDNRNYELKIRKRMFCMITPYHNGLYYCIKTKYPSKHSECSLSLIRTFQDTTWIPYVT